MKDNTIVWLVLGAGAAYLLWGNKPAEPKTSGISSKEAAKLLAETAKITAAIAALVKALGSKGIIGAQGGPTYDEKGNPVGVPLDEFGNPYGGGAALLAGW